MSGEFVPDPAAEPLIEVRELTRRYAGAHGVEALSGVSLTVYPGEFVAIVGPSGTGKSTLLNILGLLDRPSSGSYRLLGHDTTTLNERTRDRLRATQIGFVFQDAHLLPDASAATNAALGLSVRRVPRRLRAGRTAAALRRFGLGGRSRALGRQLSGGERQRVALARAVSGRPALVLADEPTGALDRANAANTVRALKELQRDGITIIVITHDLEIAASADRVLTLEDGSITEAGTGSGREAPPPEERTAQGADAADGAEPSDWPRQGWLASARDDLAEAVNSHTAHLGRAALITLAFFLGTGGLVLALGLNQSVATQIADRFGSAAGQELRVALPDTTEPGAPPSFPEVFAES
ncbi:ABC transporter ATP-binding protein, partial [Leucobacter sp. M11]|uniref:ABC transporter ATP-binding protein n=1 Tax=Leucobacter sp. M11 TaxID=2993565 RepID=UPI002D7EC5E5